MEESREIGLRLNVGQDVSQDQLFVLLRQCEHEVRRYEWTSGYILIRLWNSPVTPRKAAEFTAWVEQQTGLTLTQNEIMRRISVYRFYSRLDGEIIDLVERVGVKTAYRASRVITEQNAREVLTACLDSDSIPETLGKFAKPRSNRVANGNALAGRTQVDWLRFAARLVERAGHVAAAQACRDAADTIKSLGLDPKPNGHDDEATRRAAP